MFRKLTVNLFLFALTFSGIGSILAADEPLPSPGPFSRWDIVGPSGGDVRVIAIDPADKDRLYLSTLDGQIHGSSDGGRTWRLLVNLDQPELILDQLIVDREDPLRIYTSGHRHRGAGGFFKSTDGGKTWKESKDLRNESIHAMTQSSLDPNVLLVGTLQGIWISRDKGEKWERMNSSTMPINIDSLAVDPRSLDTIYAGTWWRAYKSTDAGKSWRLIKNGMIDDSDVFAITINPRNAEHVIASACSGIYESYNGGERWIKFGGIPSSSRRTRDIVQHPTQPATLYAGTTEGFWMSTNGGKSWAMTTQRNLEVNSIAVHPEAPNRVFLGTNNYGVMVSNDGGRSFAQANDSFSSRFTYSVTPDVENPERLYAATHNTATGGGFFFVSNDGGRNWQQARGLDVGRVRTYSVEQDRANPNNIYAGTNIGIFRSTDRGTSWTQVVGVAPKAPVRRAPAKAPAKAPVRRTASTASTTPSPAAAAPKLTPTLTDKVRAFEILPEGKGYLAGTEKGLFRSTDLTKGWEKLNFGAGLSESIFAIHVPPSKPSTIWAGTATTGVVVSNDGGKTWERTGGAVDNVPVSSIVSDPTRPDYVYVGTTQTFYLTRDGGKNWTRRGGNLSLGNFNSILINPRNPDEIILSSSMDTEGGLYISTDAGNRWKRLDTKDVKLASHRFWSVAFDPRDPNRLFAATHSSGVYRIERDAVVSQTDK
ncbi:MAG: hypothetical protein IPM50_03485 [Acidobacteriota bacterium]|nr:MAG: hypothetical protein IPM50_03485 [Acidobacteriota bacterium]